MKSLSKNIYLCLLTTFVLLLFCQQVIASNQDIIKTSLTSLWERREAAGVDSVTEVFTDDQFHINKVLENKELLNLGLIGLAEFEKVEKALRDECNAPQSGHFSSEDAVDTLMKDGLNKAWTDEVILRVLVKETIKTPLDIAVLWSALSKGIRKSGTNHIREYLYSQLMKKRSGQLLSTKEILEAFVEKSFFRDILLITTGLNNSESSSDTAVALVASQLTVSTADAMEENDTKDPFFVLEVLSCIVGKGKGQGISFVKRLREGLYEAMVVDYDSALKMVSLWSNYKNVKLGEQEASIFRNYLQPDINVAPAGSSLEGQLRWIEENLPVKLPKNTYLFGLAVMYGDDTEKLLEIIKQMDKTGSDTELTDLTNVVLEGARIAAKNNPSNKLEAALGFLNKALGQADESQVGSLMVEIQLRDRVLLEILDIYCYDLDDVESVISQMATSQGRATAGRFAYEMAGMELSDSLDEKLAAILRFFPEPSRVRDEYLDALMTTYARDGSDVTKIRVHQFSHMSEEERIKGAYGRQAAYIKQVMNQLIARSTPEEKARAILQYLNSKMEKGGKNEGEILFKSNVFSFTDALDPLDRKEIIYALLVADDGLFSDRAAEESILDELIRTQFPMREQERELLSTLFKGYILRLSTERKARVYLSLIDIVGKGLSPGEVVRTFIEKLGVVPVKFAQMVASRDDILKDPEVRAILEGLCDDVGVFDKGTAIQIIETETGKTIRELTDDGLGDLLGAGSVKQVYHVNYHGQKAVLKIIRPGAKQEVDEDLKILRAITEDLKGNPVITQYVQDPSIMVAQFERELRSEIDSQNELNNVRHFRELFKDDPEVTAPDVLLLDGDVMIEELVKGTKITKAVAKYGLDGDELAKRATKGMMAQIFRDGFFHGDPHPGNIMVTPEGQIVFIDWGMTGRLSLSQRLRLVKLFVAMLLKNSKMALRQLQNLDTKASDPMTEENEALLMEDLDFILTKPKKNGQPRKAGEKLLGLLYAGAQRGLSIPPDYTMMGKSIMCLEGTAKRLSPDIDVVPYIAKGFLNAYVNRIKSAILRPIQWLRERFSPECIQHMQVLANDENLCVDEL